MVSMLIADYRINQLCFLKG